MSEFRAIKDGEGFWNPTFNQEVITGIRGRNKENVLKTAELLRDYIIRQQESINNYGLLFYICGYDGINQQRTAELFKDVYDVEVF